MVTRQKVSWGSTIYVTLSIMTALFTKEFLTNFEGFQDLLLNIVVCFIAIFIKEKTFKPLARKFTWLDK